VTVTAGAAVPGPAAASPSAAIHLLSSGAGGLMPNGLALTPPMGWNGYNHFGRKVSASLVEAAARALVSSGMKAAGYTYVNLDGGWALPARNAQGDLQPNPHLFPQGIAPVARYVHSLGLRFGIYTSAGTKNCAGTSAGSYGHYQQDAQLFASWGVDYVKLDWCYVPFQDYRAMSHQQVSQSLASEMGEAIAATGRPIVYDVNDTHVQTDRTVTWGPDTGNLWRTTRDIRPSYASMVQHFTANVWNYAKAGPGRWNDPDMLEVGNPGLTLTEARAQFSLWAEMAAPLIAGNNVTAMSPATRTILTNASVIAVDQDELGKQGHPVASKGGHWVLAKPLQNGDCAVVLFNQTGTAATISTSASRVGLGGAARYTLRNLWTRAVTTTAGPISARVPAHGVVMYRVSGGSGQPA
jgi:alpha-galactosidase